MEPGQFDKLITALTSLGENIANSSQVQYTITGADDWDIIVILVGFFCGVITLLFTILIKMVSSMKTDVINTIKENRTEWREELAKAENLLWDEARSIRGELKYCKEKCCDGV